MHSASTTSIFMNCLGREYLNWNIDGLPQGAKVLFNQLPSRISKSIILNHTMTPYYQPFSFDKGYSLRNFPILKKSSLKYCSYCVEEDKKQFGEPYWHRKHHSPGVSTCLTHSVFLEDTRMPLYGNQKTSITLSNYLKYHPYKVARFIDPTNNFHKIVMDIALDSYWLLNNVISKRDVSILKNDLKVLFKKKTRSINLPLTLAFTNYFSDELLYQLGCRIRKTKRQDSWIHELTHLNQSCIIIPLHYFLALHFLGFSIESYIKKNDLNTPFGRGPWPCLNPLENHYGQTTIRSVYWDRTRTDPIGFFTCPICGFSYRYLASNPSHVITGRILRNSLNKKATAS